MSNPPATREADPPPFTLGQLAWLYGTFQPPPTPSSSADEQYLPPAPPALWPHQPQVSLQVSPTSSLSLTQARAFHYRHVGRLDASATPFRYRQRWSHAQVLVGVGIVMHGIMVLHAITPLPGTLPQPYPIWTGCHQSPLVQYHYTTRAAPTTCICAYVQYNHICCRQAVQLAHVLPWDARSSSPTDWPLPHITVYVTI